MKVSMICIPRLFRTFKHPVVPVILATFFPRHVTNRSMMFAVVSSTWSCKTIVTIQWNYRTFVTHPCVSCSDPFFLSWPLNTFAYRSSGIESSVFVCTTGDLQSIYRDLLLVEYRSYSWTFADGMVHLREDSLDFDRLWSAQVLVH